MPCLSNPEKVNPIPWALRSLFITGALILVISITISYLAGLAAIRASSSVTAEQAVVDQLRETLSTLKDAETGQRGYLITGEQSYILPYSSAKDRIGEELLPSKRSRERMTSPRPTSTTTSSSSIASSPSWTEPSSSAAITVLTLPWPS